VLLNKVINVEKTFKTIAILEGDYLTDNNEMKANKSNSTKNDPI